VAGSVAHSRPPYFLVCQHQRRVSYLCTPRTPKPRCGCRKLGRRADQDVSGADEIPSHPWCYRIRDLVAQQIIWSPSRYIVPGGRSDKVFGTHTSIVAAMCRKSSAPSRCDHSGVPGMWVSPGILTWTFTASFPRTRPSPTAAPGPAQLHPDGSSSSWPRALLGDLADLVVDAAVVEPVDVAEGCPLDLLDALPGALVEDQLGLVEAVEGLGHGIVVRVTAISHAVDHA
jgi:hypothetical protein